MIKQKHGSDRSAMFTVLLDVWPQYGVTDNRTAMDLNTEVLEAWYADERELSMYSFGLRYVLRWAEENDVPIEDKNVGQVRVTEWLPNTEGRVGGEHWRDYVRVESVRDPEKVHGLVSIRSLRVEDTGKAVR